MKPGLLIVKTGSALPFLRTSAGDFEDWISRPVSDLVRIVVSDVLAGEILPDPGDFCCAIVTGSHSMVTDRTEWMRNTESWLVKAVETGKPVLGICFGHQLLAHALGGEVADNPNGREFGTVSIRLTDEGTLDPLFRGIPSPFQAHSSHTQSVLQLPPVSVRLAYSRSDANHAFRIGRSYGIQFHPEFDKTVMNAYIRENRESLLMEGQNPDLLMQTVTDTVHAGSLIRRFVELGRIQPSCGCTARRIRP